MTLMCSHVQESVTLSVTIVANSKEILNILSSSLGVILPPRNIWRYLGMFLVVASRIVTGIQWTEARDASERPTVHRTVPFNRESSGSECPQGSG